MRTYLVLTVIGEDKPGIVESLAKVISDHSGSWLESSMSQLAGKFAGILRVSVDEDECDSLVISLKGISDELKLVIEKVSCEGYGETHQIIEVSLIGNDRPGIIREISRTVTALAVNFEKLTSECAPAPMSTPSQIPSPSLSLSHEPSHCRYISANLQEPSSLVALSL